MNIKQLSPTRSLRDLWTKAKSLHSSDYAIAAAATAIGLTMLTNHFMGSASADPSENSTEQTSHAGFTLPPP